jgi:hypothetical protein
MQSFVGAMPGFNPSIRFREPTARNSDTTSSIFTYTLVKTHTIDTYIIQMQNKRQSLCYSPETSNFVLPKTTLLSSHHPPYITYALSTSLGN